MKLPAYYLDGKVYLERDSLVLLLLDFAQVESEEWAKCLREFARLMMECEL